MDIDSIQDAEIERMRIALARMEGKNKRKSVKGSFSVKKKLRVAPITKRMRSIGVTPRTAQKADTRTSRSRQIQPRKLTFGSGTNSRSASRPRSMNIDAPLQKSVQYTQSRKVRHNNARKVLNKMPAGGKPYARRRMTSRKPKGAYRGAVMPKWAKGETKHILAGDGCDETIATMTNDRLASGATGVAARNVAHEILIGDKAHFSLNPVSQGTGEYQRNGKSINGTYLRIQGHMLNTAGQHGGSNDNVTGTAGQRAYVRMLVLAVKGQSVQGTDASTGQGADNNLGRPRAPLIMSQLFKRIDGSVTGFAKASDAASATASVRSLQLPVNKQLYTVLADQKMQLASTAESFGSSDRLFDLKIPLKQKTEFGNDRADSFSKNQLVFVVMTVDPACNDTIPNEKIHLEFESKYSYKDF